MQPSADSEPLLSVAIVVGARRELATRCLRSVLSQDRIGEAEILILDLGPGGSTPLAASDHAAVRLVRMSPQTTYGQARALAVRQARAPVVAFLEEHVWPHPGWADALLRAHHGPWAAVGPEVHSANPGVGKSDIVGLMTYGLFAPPQRASEVELLPGHNTSYKVSALLAYGDQLSALLATENLLFTVLRRDGHRLAIEPAAKIDHLHTVGWWDTAQGYLLYNRAYGHWRARFLHWPAWRRLVYILATPLIPAYFLFRTRRLLQHRDPAGARLLLRQLPFVLVTQLAAAVGQAVGLLAGPGTSELKFTLYELNVPRPAAHWELPAEVA